MAEEQKQEQKKKSETKAIAVQQSFLQAVNEKGYNGRYIFYKAEDLENPDSTAFSVGIKDIDGAPLVMLSASAQTWLLLAEYIKKRFSK